MKTDTTQQNIPSGWIIKTLAELGEFKTGGVDKKIKQDEKPVRLVNYMDVYKRKFIDDSINFMEVTASDSEIKAAQVKAGDMLFTPSSETPDDIGHSAVVAENLPNTLFSYHLARLRFNEEYDDKIDLNFRAYFCNSRDVLKQFEKMSVGATRYTISKGKFESVQVLIPKSKQEQQKIAGILGTVDEDIAKTQGVIEATEKLKRGLMQQLFTRGIGHTKFKETKIGQIPDEWDLVQIKDAPIKIADGNYSAKYPRQDEFLEDGIPFVRVNNLQDQTLIKEDLKYISAEKHADLKKGHLQTDDVLITTRGKLGVIALVPKEFDDANINAQIVLLRADNKELQPKFLMYFLLSPEFQSQVFSGGSGSALQQLPVRVLENTYIPIPTPKEQKEIAEILSAVDEKISINKKLKDKLTFLKKGLMQDLLSGTVRTNI